MDHAFRWSNPGTQYHAAMGRILLVLSAFRFAGRSEPVCGRNGRALLDVWERCRKPPARRSRSLRRRNRARGASSLVRAILAQSALRSELCFDRGTFPAAGESRNDSRPGQPEDVQEPRAMWYLRTRSSKSMARMHCGSTRCFLVRWNRRNPGASAASKGFTASWQGSGVWSWMRIRKGSGRLSSALGSVDLSAKQQKVVHFHDQESL